VAAWPTKRMDELCEITSSKRIYAADYVSEGVPFYRGKEIGEKHRGSLSVSTELFITRPKFDELRSKFGASEAGDLLLTSIGALGSPYVVKQGEEFYFKDGNLTWFRHLNGLDSHFLYYWLLSPQGKGQLQKSRIGSAQPAFTISLLKQMELKLPPIPMQRRIAGILSAYDELIENSQRRIRILEAMARALYREWFVHFRFPDHENLPRVASTVGEITPGWKVETLESLMLNHIGGGWGKETADERHTEPAWVIRGTDIPDARSSRVGAVPHRFHTVSNLRSRHLQTGDILFEVSGGSKGQSVGRTLLVTPQLLSAFGDDSVICASFCKRVRPDDVGYGSELLYLSFLEAYESGEIEQFQVQSTGISNFKWTEYIAKTERAIPPSPLRARFRERVAPLFSQIATLGLQVQNLCRMRDLLLPRLLSGQLEVKAS
jgi:type I restriction enzyme S subunit